MMSFKAPPLPPEPEVKPAEVSLQPKSVPAKIAADVKTLAALVVPEGHTPTFLAAATKRDPQTLTAALKSVGSAFVPNSTSFYEANVPLRGSDRWVKLATNEMKLVEIWLEANPKNPIQYGWDMLDLLDILVMPKSEICWSHKLVDLEKATAEPGNKVAAQTVKNVLKPAPAEVKAVVLAPKPASQPNRIVHYSEIQTELGLTAENVKKIAAENKLSVFHVAGDDVYRFDDLLPFFDAKNVAPPAVKLPPPPVVQFKGVTKTYGGKKPYTAIKDVSFTVEDIPYIGEMIAILGPSGCGKSTVLKLIAGLEPQFPATTGEVLVLGKPVTGPGADRGMVFQEYTAFPNRTVLDNIAFGLECRGMNSKTRHELAKHWMEKVGLKPDKDAHKYPHQLSGGMRQRVAIARSLVLSPRILLMDEPFGALDPMTSMRMQDLLISLWKNSETTVFFVTHSIPEAVFLGDRVYLFSNAPGTIVEEVASPRPEEPAVDAYQKNEFQEKVKNIRLKIAKMEEEKGVI